MTQSATARLNHAAIFVSDLDRNTPQILFDFYGIESGLGSIARALQFSMSDPDAVNAPKPAFEGSSPGPWRSQTRLCLKTPFDGWVAGAKRSGAPGDRGIWGFATLSRQPPEVVLRQSLVRASCRQTVF